MTDCAGTGNVLLVDDNADFRSMMAEVAQQCGCRIVAADTLEAGRRLASRHEFDLLLIDLVLPDGNGLDLVEAIDLAMHGQLAVITGHPSLETAVRAVGAPVVEYLVKPVPTSVLVRLMKAAHERALGRSPQVELGGMVGRSAAMQKVFEQVQRVAPLDACVFLHGESGTGKELVARAVHDLSGRSGRFVAINCGAIASELLSSQLFGHERGSFTGALQTHAGYFEQAGGGTLFLDEITEMPLALQVYLLRVLENRMLTRVGGTREIAIDVRIVAGLQPRPATCARGWQAAHGPLLSMGSGCEVGGTSWSATSLTRATAPMMSSSWPAKCSSSSGFSSRRASRARWATSSRVMPGMQRSSGVSVCGLGPT